MIFRLLFNPTPEDPGRLSLVGRAFIAALLVAYVTLALRVLFG